MQSRYCFSCPHAHDHPHRISNIAAAIFPCIVPSLHAVLIIFAGSAGRDNTTGSLHLGVGYRVLADESCSIQRTKIKDARDLAAIPGGRVFYHRQ
jgi:hypothetical protein